MGGHLFNHDIATRSLEEMQELASFMPETIYAMNPIAVYETMASTDDFAYCPFAYTYSNYSRPGSQQFPALCQPGVSSGRKPGTYGTRRHRHCGLRHSCATLRLLSNLAFVAGSDCQSHLYGVCGGQPASWSAWRNPLLNQISNDFFERTVGSIQAAYVRPRYPGYIALQRSAGVPVIEYLRRQTTAIHALQQLEDLYRQSLPKPRSGAETIR